MVKLMCPQNLNLEDLIKANPFPLGRGLKKDSLLFIIHSLMVRGASLSVEHLEKLGKKDDFIPLNANVLKSKIPQYLAHLKYLEEVGVIESDNSYIVGQVSKGYKLTQPYRGIDFQKVGVTDFTLSQKIKKDNPFTSSNKAYKNYPYLAKWFSTQKLQIDEVAAYDWINEYEKLEITKLNSAKIGSAKRYKQKVKLNEKCKNYKILVNRITEHDYFFKVDETGNRLHTNLTNLPKVFRQFITYDNQPLVSIDVKNSQPYMSTALLKKEFWQSKDLAQKPTLKKVYKELYRLIKGTSNTNNSIIMFLHSSGSLYRTDLQNSNFIKSAVEGNFYEMLVSLFDKNNLFKRGMTEEDKRNKVKGVVFGLFFDNHNKIYNRNCGSVYNLFKQNFPNVVRVFEYAKKHDYRDLAVILQRIESYLLLNNVCSKVSKSRPDIPLFTIHDCIITTQGNESYVQSVIDTELIKCMGFSPKLSIENWQRTQVQKSVGVI